MSTDQPRRPFPVGRYAVVLVVIVVLMWLPTTSTLIANAIADAAGCKIFMGSATPCQIAGIDWGGLLYGMDYSRYFIVLTIPIFGLMLGLWLIWSLVALVLWRWPRTSR